MYYMWTPLILMAISALCYFPQSCWNRKENLMNVFFGGNNQMNRISLSHEEENHRQVHLLKCFNRSKSHYSYIKNMVWYETLNIVTFGLSVLIINFVLSGRFFHLGPTFIRYYHAQNFKEINPRYPVHDMADFPTMMYLFPVVTKCDVYSFGYSVSWVMVSKLGLILINIPMNYMRNSIIHNFRLQ